MYMTPQTSDNSENGHKYFYMDSENMDWVPGVVSFNTDGGYWLIHSVPEFPPKSSKSYSYPQSALKHGHIHLCISLKKDKIDELWNQFLYTVPYVYDQSVPESMRKKKDFDAILDHRHVDNMVTEPKSRMVLHWLMDKNLYILLNLQSLKETFMTAGLLLTSRVIYSHRLVKEQAKTKNPHATKISKLLMCSKLE